MLANNYGKNSLKKLLQTEGLSPVGIFLLSRVCCNSRSRGATMPCLTRVMAAARTLGRQKTKKPAQKFNIFFAFDEIFIYLRIDKANSIHHISNLLKNNSFINLLKIYHNERFQKNNPSSRR